MVRLASSGVENLRLQRGQALDLDLDLDFLEAGCDDLRCRCP